MTLETLLAAANFVEANVVPADLTRANGRTALNSERGGSHHREPPAQSAIGVRNRQNSIAETSRGVGGASCASGNTRQLHNKLEKNRRAVLKDCFVGLKHLLPSIDEKRSSHLDVLRVAIEYVKNLKLKSDELENSRLELQRQRLSLQKRLGGVQLNSSPGIAFAAASPSTDTADSCSSLDGCELAANSIANVTQLTNGPPVICSETSTSPHLSQSIQGCDGARQTVSNSAALIPAVGAEDDRRHSDAVAALAGLHAFVHDTRFGVTSTHLTGTSSSEAVPPSYKLPSTPVVDVQLPSSHQTAVQLLQQTLLQKSSVPNILSGSPINGNAFQFQSTSVTSAAVGLTSVVSPSLARDVQIKSRLSSPIHLAPVMVHGNAASAAAAAAAPANIVATSSGAYILTFDHSSFSAGSNNGLKLQPLPSSSAFTGSFAPGIGQFVLCPAANGITQSLMSSPVPFIGGGSLPNGFSLICASSTNTQTFPLLQLSAIVQAVPVVQSQVVSGPTRSIVTAPASDGTTVFVMPS